MIAAGDEGGVGFDSVDVVSGTKLENDPAEEEFSWGNIVLKLLPPKNGTNRPAFREILLENLRLAGMRHPTRSSFAKASADTFLANFERKVAERIGFEPTVGCPTPDFESGALDHSATSP